MTTPEIIAYLNLLETRLEAMKMEVKNIKQVLFETLDNGVEEMLD